MNKILNFRFFYFSFSTFKSFCVFNIRFFFFWLSIFMKDNKQEEIGTHESSPADCHMEIEQFYELKEGKPNLKKSNNSSKIIEGVVENLNF